MENQTFNISTGIGSIYIETFLKIFFAIILIYGFIMVVNFFRDKFIKKENLTKNPQITDLLGILNKLCFFTGIGFVIGNLLYIFFKKASYTSIRGESWEYLTFGVILIFVGIGFKAARKTINN